MPQYLSPGIYVEEVPSAVKPIAGVGTSTAGFIGRVPNTAVMPPIPGSTNQTYTIAPATTAQLITGWEQFKNTFGDFQTGAQADNTLAHAVYGFFNNGGTRCWVTRTNDALSADNVTAALKGFASIDEIALVAVPGATDATILGPVLDHCENVGDRFAILDGARNPADPLVPSGVQGTLRNSNYAAMYFPWISVYDPGTKRNLVVPPSGHIAGIYARVDGQRGVHKAPANEVIRGALTVERRLSKADQDGMNPAGINLIRVFGNDIIVWGARTLGGNANNEWKYINVRRLFLFLRKSIEQGTGWVVFEPNDMALWAKIVRNVSAFLTNVWRDGALFGGSPQEAFYVRCDAQTNPPEIRALGMVITEIGVAVVTPAEFVIFRISQWAGPAK